MKPTFNQIFLFVISCVLVVFTPLFANHIPSQVLFPVEVCALALLLFWMTQLLPQDKLKLRKGYLDKPLETDELMELVECLTMAETGKKETPGEGEPES